MERGTSETRVFDGIENLYKRGRVRRLAHGLREFLTIGLRHPKFRSFIAYNCKSIVAVLNILGFLMRLPWEGIRGWNEVERGCNDIGTPR